MRMFLENSKNTLIPMLASIGISLAIILPVLLYDFITTMFGPH